MMDEAEIVNIEKLERISINSSDNQATTYIFLNNRTNLFLSYIQKNHEILSWLYNHAAIPTLIWFKMRANSYKCLSANMKTIESLHELLSGANATQCCNHYLQRKTKSIIITKVVARAASQKRTPTWEGGLFASGISSKPISLKTLIGRWKHVLPIPSESAYLHYIQLIAYVRNPSLTLPTCMDNP